MSKRKYTVSGAITISVSTDVLASSEKEAMDLALERPMISLCHQCSRGDPDVEWITSGELDGGEPVDLVCDLD
jgi:hypothetical protein